MGKVLAILLAMIGLGAGIGAGIALRPAPVVDVSINPCGDGTAPVMHAEDHAPKDDESKDSEFVKINNQFVIPVVHGDEVSALVVMALSIEVEAGHREIVYQREPKLRDAYLQVLFDHANAGGFDGAFTAGPNMKTLRVGLVEVSRALLGDIILDVLITDVARQDV